jgi:hypothetical protein
VVTARVFHRSSFYRHGLCILSLRLAVNTSM